MAADAFPRHGDRLHCSKSMNLPERLRTGAPLIATFSMIASPIIVELLAQAGFEAVVLDMEHGPLGIEDLNILIPVSRAAGIYPIVRVRTSEASLIGAALDVGAAGILVPQVDSGPSAAAVVSAARFAPLGLRGVNPYTRAAGYNASREWYARANAEVAVLVMVEGNAGVLALPEILDTPGIDGIFIGPYDLSQALGVAGQLDHPTVLATVEQIVTAASKRNLATAVFAPTPPLALRWIELGVRLVAAGFDTAMVLDGFRAVRRAVT